MKTKIISIILLTLFILLFTPNVFAVVDAEGNEIIEIEDEVLKKSIDSNSDGEVSIVEIKRLQFLSIYPGVKNLEALNYAENLIRISFYDYTEEDLNILNSLNETVKNKIKHLTVQAPYDKKSNLSDISALSGFVNLTHLSISGNRNEKCNLNDITPIQNLTKLEHLDITNTSVTDISCLNNLTNLTYLSISNNEITSIDVISNFTNLKDIYAHDNNIVNIDVIANLSKLRNIDLYNNKIKNIPDLSKINDASYRFDNNEIEDISGLSDANFSNLNLRNNKIKDISPLLLNHSSVQAMDLSYNLLDSTCIDVISQMPNKIYDLSIDNNNISGTVVLDNVKAEYISLQNNPFETFIVDGNDDIGSLGRIDENKNLKTVSITNMKKINGITICDNPKLENVTISNIGAEANYDINIYINNCNISDLSGLSNIANENSKRGIYLYLNNNKIEDFSPLLSNNFLKRIELIDNNVNPYTEQSKALIYTLAEYGCTDLKFGDCSRFLEENVLTEEAKNEVVNVEVNGTEVTTIPSVKGTAILDFISKKIVKNDNYDIKIISNKGDEKKEGLIGSRDVVIITDENQNQFSYIVIVPGDVTGNGYVRMYDSFEILKGAVTGNKGLDEIDYLIRDYNEDGNIRMYDAFQYLREAVSGK